MRAPEHSPFTALYAPHSELELSLLRSPLEAENIPYQVTNDHFGSLYIGVQIEAFNRRGILIDAAFLPKAQAVLEDFIARQNHASAPFPQHTSHWWDKLRTLLEVVLLGWIVPRHQPSQSGADMTYELRFVQEHNLFIATTTGSLTAPGMTDLGRALLAHPQWQAGAAVVFDHRQLAFGMTPVADLEAIRAFHRDHQDQIGNGKSAFVVGPGRSDAWLALWHQGNKLTMDHRTAVLDTMEEALAWIRQEN